VFRVELLVLRINRSQLGWIEHLLWMPSVCVPEEVILKIHLLHNKANSSCEQWWMALAAMEDPGSRLNEAFTPTSLTTTLSKYRWLPRSSNQVALWLWVDIDVLTTSIWDHCQPCKIWVLLDNALQTLSNFLFNGEFLVQVDAAMVIWEHLVLHCLGCLGLNMLLSYKENNISTIQNIPHTYRCMFGLIN